MAGSYNKVLLMGNLTRDVELRNVNQTHVATFGLAMNERYKSRDGEAQERVDFVDCQAWGNTAEAMAKYLGKGRPVLIEGRLRLDQWQDKDGSNRSKLKVVVDNFTFVDSKSDAPGTASASPPASASRGGKNEPPPFNDDDIPF